MKKFLIMMLAFTSMVQALAKISEEVQQQLDDNLDLFKFFKDKEEQKSLNGVDFFTIGADAQCQYSSIQAAIDDYFQSPFSNMEMRIATNKTYFENIQIPDVHIDLIGGYSNCTNANANIRTSSQAVIDGGDNDAVIKIENIATRRSMTFTNLNIINGDNTQAPGGGLLSILSDVAIFFNNVDIRSNKAIIGGGIAIIAGNTDMVINNSLIFDNRGLYGGGFYCSGSDSTILLTGTSGIVANVANGQGGGREGRGGGVYLEDQCRFSMYSGSSNPLNFAGIQSNISVTRGPGIYADFGSRVVLYGHEFCNSTNTFCIGDDVNPVNVNNNTSIGVVSKSISAANNSEVFIFAGLFANNEGGNIYVEKDSTLTISRLKKECWNQLKCNLFTGSLSSSIQSESSNVDISYSYFENNFFTLGGIFVIIDKVDSTVNFFKFESNVVAGNNYSGGIPRSLFAIVGPLDTFIIHNTFVDNSGYAALAFLDWDHDGSSGPVSPPPNFKMHSCIFQDSGTELLDPSFAVRNEDIVVNISALITTEIDSINGNSHITNDAVNFAGGDFITLINSNENLFVDRANGNYGLNANSLAIDYFNTPSRTTVTHKDITFQDRGFDDPNNQSPISGLFYYDMGASERVEMSDLIFANGFE